MAQLPESFARGVTYADIDGLPDDHVIRTLLGGELFVSPPPTFGHQQVVVQLCGVLGQYAKQTGGKVSVAPGAVYFDERNFVEPDLFFIRADHLESCGVLKSGARRVEGPPDLVIEVSSPSTRRFDRVLKRKMYQDYGIAHYWFVDLEAGNVRVFNLGKGGYGEPEFLAPGSQLEASSLPGLSVSVGEILAP